MTLLEGKGFEAAKAEVKDKFPKTLRVCRKLFNISNTKTNNDVCIFCFQIAIFIIPVLQTINFGLVPEPNRILFVSFCSLFWITFLAHMQKQGEKAEQNTTQKQQLKQFQHHLPALKNESLIPKVNNALAL